MLVMVLGLTGIGAAWLQSQSLHRQTEASALLQNHMTADMMHDAIRADVLAAIEAKNPGSGLKREDILDDFAEHLKTLQEAIAEDARYTGSAEVAAVTGKLAAPMTAYTDAAQAMLAIAETDSLRATAGLPAFFVQFRTLEQSMAAASDAIAKHQDETAAAGTLIGTLAEVTLGIALVLGMAVAVMLARAASHRVIRPIVSLTATMRELGAGNLSAQPEGTDRQDELGEMANAMLAFRDQVAAAEESKHAQAQLIVGSLGDGLTALAAGDLTASIDADLAPPFTQLKVNFNEATASLHALIGSVTESAATIRTGSSEIAQASEDLARRTEANASTLEETNAAVSQMDARLKATATAAKQTVSRADGAIATVAGGRAIADEAVQAMTRVSESAKGIDSVIEGLDKIAFQTRVLAMNAAVEAGRAGESGRGFAVVADLVSALAMRAEEEAGRARDQLTTTQTDIVAAVEMVQKVDGALINISGDVREVHSLLDQMAADNQAQSNAIGEISTAISAMDNSTQQNAAMVEQTSAAARNLTSEVGSLSAMAGQFTIAGTARQPARRSAAPGPTPAPAPKAAPAASVTSISSEEWASF
ncbi:methyl-accepting chemotaxis protein [Sphingomonas sp. CJ20]